MLDLPVKHSLRKHLNTPTPRCSLSVTSATLKILIYTEASASILFLLTMTPGRVTRTCLWVSRGHCLRDYSLTCPQAHDNTHVLSISLHNDGSQDLAAEQGGLETVGQGIEAPVAQHGHLVMEGAASERKLRAGGDRSSVSTTEPCRVHCTSVGSRAIFHHPTPQTCTLLRPGLKPRNIM